MRRVRTDNFTVAPLAFAMVLSLGVACTPAAEAPGEVLRTEKDPKYGIITCSEATADRTCVTGRSILGVAVSAVPGGSYLPLTEKCW